MDSYILNTNNILPIKLPVISRPKFLMCWNIVNFFGELITSEEGCIMTSTESDKTGFYYSQWKQFHSYINTYDITMIGTKNQCNYLRDLVKSYKMIMGRVSDCITYIEVNDKKELKKELDKLINKNTKFDVCLMNPPYGDGQNKGLHYEFVEKVVDICSETYCVMPFGLINKYSSTDIKYKPVLGPHTVYAEEINGDIFPGTTQHNVGIYKFTANVNDNIHIEYIDGRTCNVSMLTNNPIDMADSTVKHIVDILSSNGNYTRYMRFCGKFSNVNSECKKAGITDQSVIDKMIYDKIADNCTRQLPLNKKYLMVNMANGAMNAHYISGNTGLTFNNITEVIDMLYKLKKTNGFNFIIFDSIKELNNCKIALENPLLRTLLSIIQYDQSMTITNCYKYIPNIDWSDPRVVTDEGLLEVCGCPKEKCKEYAEYCSKYMEEFDK